MRVTAMSTSSPLAMGKCSCQCAGPARERGAAQGSGVREVPLCGA